MINVKCETYILLEPSNTHLLMKEWTNMEQDQYFLRYTVSSKIIIPYWKWDLFPVNIFIDFQCSACFDLEGKKPFQPKNI